MKSDYEDLIELPHHVSETHPLLTMEQRAAQFMPFAALSGFSEAIEKTDERVTDNAIDAEKGRIVFYDSE
ncbi:MAG: hypothetical protein HUK25_01290 [Treponema sp.]|nr:hypothetical protein [Treponema sp.]